MVHDMCNLHASNVRVPMGWTLQDMRSTAEETQLAADAYVARSGSEGASPLRLVGA